MVTGACGTDHRAVGATPPVTSPPPGVPSPQGRFVFVDGFSQPFSNWSSPCGGGGGQGASAAHGDLGAAAQAPAGEAGVHGDLVHAQGAQRPGLVSFSIDTDAPVRTAAVEFLVRYEICAPRCPLRCRVRLGVVPACVCMYVCMYVCVYVCMYVCAHTQVCMYVCMYVCMHLRIYMHTPNTRRARARR